MTLNPRRVSELALCRGARRIVGDEIDIYDQLVCEAAHAEEAGDETRAAQLRAEAEDQLVHDTRARLWQCVQEVGFDEVGRLLRELAEMEGIVRRPVSRTLRQRVYERDEFRCVECGELDPKRLSVDHIVPVIRGGSNALTNLRTLCRSCNSAKGAAL